MIYSPARSCKSGASVVHWDLPQRDREQDAAPALAELNSQGQPALGRTEGFSAKLPAVEASVSLEKGRVPCPLPLQCLLWEPRMQRGGLSFGGRLVLVLVLAPVHIVSGAPGFKV